MTSNTNRFNKIEEAIEDFKMGKPLIVADDEDRENEGDLICSAQFVTPELVNFITKECRGIVCLAISNEIAAKLELPQMVEKNTESMQTAFSLSIDAHPKYGVTTGVSAYDRAKTIEAGCTDFMAKPISAQALKDMIRKYLPTQE